MAVVFSEEQSNVINLRDRNILVSAAAGSGKTTVLVERIIQMITDEKNPVDIDHLLVVTFTNAAAASMREKISNAIAKRLESEYSDHLQKQATLIHHAQITTIDSFCLFILQNNFNDIGLEPGFRVADQGEIRLLKEDVMDNLLEKRLLEDADGKFEHLLNRFVKGSKFAGFRDVLFSLYERALSYPFVKDWLMERKADYDIGEDFDSAAWVQEIFAYAVRDLAYCKELALQNVEDCKAAGGPSTYLPMMEADLALVDELLACDSYTKLHEKIQVLDFIRLSTKKDESADPDFKELVKKHRDEFKKTLQNLQKDFFAFSVEDMREAAAENAVIVEELCDTLLAFHEDFLAVKKDKKLIDFSDMEHFALEILLKKEGDAYVPTKTALEYREYFHEIMIDEYQDSNLVQEWLLQCISKEDEGVYNRFMVGDVKQSIYQFRLARPQIFMEKFDTYEKEVHDAVRLQRIDLAKNYRSRREVVECVNYLFYRIMGRDLGNVAYDKDSALYLGASFADKEQGIPDTAELCLLEKEEDSDNAKEQEARMIALKIKELLKDYYVTDEHTGELRKASYRDIVILLRKTKEWDEVFKTVFESEGIPAYVTKSSGYFETGEIRVLLNFLKCLDNPKQDIALFGTMTSSLGGFTDEEMALVCSAKEASLWKKVQVKALLADDALAAKCKNFLTWYTGYREQIPYEPIHKILRSVIQEKGYLYEVASMPGGQQRLANVQMLLAKAESFEKSSYSGLFHFIRYIDKVQKYDIEFGEAGIMDEQDDVVRIMTIHKSKGLEFPICFVAGCAGRFNQMDAQKAIICDSNYGIGLDYVDIDNRVKYKDLRKRFLAKHIVEENLGEELRVLYVALTRAKEKLILTGICPSFEKLAQKIDGRRKDGVLCHLRSRISAKSYLDWIVEAMAHHPAFAEALEPYGYGIQTVEQDASDIAVSLYTPQMIEEKSVELSVSNEWNKEKLLRMIEEPQEALDDELLKQIHFTYRHENLRNLYTKTSVSELKMAAMHKAFEKESVEEAAKPMFDTEVMNPYIPKFASGEKEASGSDRGSAYHRVLELLDYEGLAGMLNGDVKVWYEAQLQSLIDAGRITKEEVDLVNPKKICTFLQSPVAARMAQAAVRGDLYKEQPFVLAVSAKDLSEEFPEEEKVLIQGIIDVYFIEDNEIVLLDYKTDVVNSGEELVQRYKTQLDYYRKALENINGRKVKERLLYAFRLEETVEVK
ncbi:MAG: helicase-exonuclease AddAB subunit AddA [Lachnospiraceae bacterium]|nr:helicase-exonuclease AddAB subunit AddA [Lachnospiraceae bacterium]